MITPKDIERKTMNEEKKKEAQNSIFGYYVGRPLSYILTIPLLYTNISPNMVTCISIIFLMIGFMMLSVASTTSIRLIGLLFIFLWNMGDGIDGNIARFKNIKSANGDLLDTLGGYLAIVLIILGMGNAAFNDTYSRLPMNYCILQLSGISAVATLIPRVLMHRKIASKNASTVVIALKNKSSYGFSKKVMLNICDPAGFQEIFMLIAIIFHGMTEFTLIYFVINISVMIYSIYKLLD